MARPFKMTKIRWALAIIIWLILISCPFMVVNSKQQQIPAVRLDKTTRADITSYVSGPSTIKPRVNVDISANIMGKVTRIYVKEGQPVKKGDKLLELEQTQYLAGRDEAGAAYRSALRNLELMEAKWSTAQDVFKRKQELYNQKLISPEQYDLAKTQYQAERTEYLIARDNVTRARAALTQAKDSLSKTIYTAPLDGVVTAVNVEVGEFTVVGTTNTPGTVICTVADLAAMEATTDIDETDVVHVRLGQPANVTVDAFPEKIFRGEVVEIASHAKENLLTTATTEKASADFEVKVIVRGDTVDLKPGMNATTDIETAAAKNVVAIPIQALVTRSREQVEAWKKGQDKGKATPTVAKTSAGPTEYVKGVFILVKEKPLLAKAKFVEVRTGVSGDQYIEITKGLRPGDEIIAGPYKILRNLSDGDVIRVDTGRPGAKEAGDEGEEKK